MHRGDAKSVTCEKVSLLGSGGGREGKWRAKRTMARGEEDMDFGPLFPSPASSSVV